MSARGGEFQKGWSLLEDIDEGGEKMSLRGAGGVGLGGEP